MKNAMAIFLLLSIGYSAKAQISNTWKGGKPGCESDWNMASNWSLNRVPDWTQDVFIPDLSASTHPYPILAGQNVEIRSLRLESGATLTILDKGAILLPGGEVIRAKNIRGFIDSRFDQPDTRDVSTAMTNR